MSFDGLRSRLLNWLGVQTEPEHVERASRKERWKRHAWMVTSFAIAWIVVSVPMSVLVAWVDWFPRGVAGLWPVFVGIGLIVVVEVQLFSWGIERFDLVEPWQFRDTKEGIK